MHIKYSIQANNIEGFSNFNLMTKSNEMIPLVYAFDFLLLKPHFKEFFIGSAKQESILHS